MEFRLCDSWLIDVNSYVLTLKYSCFNKIFDDGGYQKNL
jgi:hypothetical protein